MKSNKKTTKAYQENKRQIVKEGNNKLKKQSTWRETRELNKKKTNEDEKRKEREQKNGNKEQKHNKENGWNQKARIENRIARREGIKDNMKK